jgi:hypothetical protein
VRAVGVRWEAAEVTVEGLGDPGLGEGLPEGGGGLAQLHLLPFGGRRIGYGVEPDHAVVLAVPRFAARHAADHTRDDRQRIVLGPELVAGSAGPDEWDVLALLRGAYPYLPADAEGDGPGARPMATVTTARAVRRAAQLGRRAAYSGPDSMEVYNDLAVGTYSWVPDDEHPGPAAAEMENLPVHWLNDWTLCLDVECGRRDETVLHRLYGTVTSYEPGTGRVGFSPTGGHPAISVPVHRIVALTGDRRRRGNGQVPAHEPYDEGRSRRHACQKMNPVRGRVFGRAKAVMLHRARPRRWARRGCAGAAWCAVAASRDRHTQLRFHPRAWLTVATPGGFHGGRACERPAARRTKPPSPPSPRTGQKRHRSIRTTVCFFTQRAPPGAGPARKRRFMHPPAALFLTADRRRSTGQSHQALCALLLGSGRPLSIPAARHVEQARLEAAVFQRVCAMGGLSEHPLGIVRVRPQEGRLTLQLVDEPSVISHWIDFLYPRVSEEAGDDPRDRVSGVPGLRSAREAGGIRLYRPGMAAAITLSGFNPR